MRLFGRPSVIVPTAENLDSEESFRWVEFFFEIFHIYGPDPLSELGMMVCVM